MKRLVLQPLFFEPKLIDREITNPHETQWYEVAYVLQVTTYHNKDSS